MPATDITFCIVPVPGPAGPSGADGADGADGLNAYTLTTASFIMPDGTGVSPDVTIAVANNSWAGLNETIYVQVGGAQGYFQLISKTGTMQMTLRNLEDGTGLYTINSPPTTVFASGALVVPAGLQGPQGSAAAAGAPLDATYITQTPNGTLTSEQALSGLATGMLKNTTATGVLSIGTPGTDFYAPGSTDVAVADGGTGASNTANAQINLGLVPGLDIQAFNALLQVIANLAPTVADRYIYTTGVNTVSLATITAFARGLLDDTDAATMRATLGVTSTLDLLIYRHQASSGVNGGTFTSGSWQTVPINTEVVDTGSHGSIAGNTMTLAAGTYRYRFGVLGFQVEKFQGRLYNVTDAGALTDSYGCVVGASGGGTEATISAGVGRFTIASSKAIRLEAQCSTTGTTTGFGIAASFGGGEVYSFIELEKE